VAEQQQQQRQHVVQWEGRCCDCRWRMTFHGLLGLPLF
jgi:hypothetical protein